MTLSTLHPEDLAQSLRKRLVLYSSSRPMTEETIGIVTAAQNGDAQAFNRLVEQFKRRVFGTLYRIVGKREEVEDVAQEVFVRLHQSLPQLRSPEVFETWLYRLTTHAAYDHLRRQMRRESIRMSDLSEEQVRTVESGMSGEAFAGDTRHADVRELMQHILERVSEKDRVLLVLKEVEGRSLKELSAILGCNVNAVKVRLFRARKRALKAYEEMLEAESAANRPTAPLQLIPQAG